MPACASCGQDNPAGFRFCGACGARLATAPAQRPLGTERKVVTVLFCDLVGFTARSDQADPEDVGAMLRPFHTRLRAEIERLGGTLDKFIGDAVMAVFGAPAAHEDDPERAVRCALRILAAIGELNRANPALGLAVRIGIMTGEALVDLDAGPETETVVGDVVNTASRLEGVAPGGGAVVGEPTWRATRALFDFEALDPVTVKGKAAPLAIWRVLAARSRPGVDVRERAPTPLVGRDAELAVLEAELATVMRTRAPRLVTVLGGPGVGKSRLVHELYARVDARPELIAWRQGRCLPYGDGISFWALGEIVKAQAGVLESDEVAEVTAKLDHALADLVADQAEREWLKARLAPLLGLASSGPARTDRAEAFAAWRRLLEAVAARRPLVVVVEDLHWAEDALLDFVEHLVDEAAEVPMLVLATARLELPERRQSLAEGRRRSAVRLKPLSDQHTAALVTALVGRAVLPAEVQALLLERAGGNPLYAEEFVRLLTDKGLLVPSGRSVRLAAGAEVPFPDTVQALIAARIDTLDAGAKALLHDAAVLGRVFWSGGLASVSGRDEAGLLAGLAALERRELVRAAPRSSVEGQAEYAFWHVLIRDVAYAQLPRRGRAARHRAVAEWLTGLAGERAADHAELVAYHYTQALDLATASRAPAAEIDGLREPCRLALVAAGDRTINLDAPRASAYYARALALWPAEDPERARVLVASARATYQATGELAAVAAAYEEAIAALAAKGDRLGQGSAMERLAVVRWTQGDTRLSRSILADAIDLLEHEPPGPELASIYAQMATDRTMAGQAGEALAWADKALAVAEGQGDERLRLRALDARGVARCESGDLGGLADLRAALAAGLASGAGYDTGVVYNLLIEPLWLAEGPRSALATCTEALDFVARRGLASSMSVWFTTSLLSIRFDLGQWDQVVAGAEEVVATERAQGARYASVSAESYLAQVLCLRGQVARAGELVAGLLPDARAIDDLQALVPALVTAAVVGEAAGDLAAAGAALDELAALVAERSGGQWYQAQSIADLARVAVACGRPETAAALADAAWPDVARHTHGAASARALLAEHGGDLEGAAAGYDRAAEAWAAYGHLPETGHALLGAGRCLAALGRAGGAERLTEARRILGGLGARAVLARAG